MAGSAYLAAAMKAGSAGTKIFGMRLHYTYLKLVQETLARLYTSLETDAARFSQAFGNPLYIYLSRSDKIAQAISLVKAE